jgi:hypothetical protein
MWIHHRIVGDLPCLLPNLNLVWTIEGMAVHEAESKLVRLIFYFCQIGSGDAIVEEL